MAEWLTKRGDKYVWTGGFETKDMPKQAGFRWDSNDRVWWTTFKDNASKLSKYAPASLKAELDGFVEKKEQSIVASRAASADVPLPVPEGLDYLPFQKAGIQYALKRDNVLFGDEMGLGKHHSVDTPVLTLGGWVPIGSVRVGDYVVGVDGAEHRVTGVFSQGEQDIYDVAFSDGVVVEAGLPHLWAVRNSNDRCRHRPYRVLTTAEIMGRLSEIWSVPLTKPVLFPAKVLPIPPYVLGVILGDGSLTSFGISFVCGDSDVPVAVGRRLSSSFELHRGADYGTSTRHSVTLRNNGSRHPWTSYLASVGLKVTGERKFVPNDYLFSSVQDRWELLRGLMDTDGTVSAGNRIRFNSSSRALSLGVVHLVRSLGGVASIGRDEYNTVCISNLSESPFEARHGQKCTTHYRSKTIKGIELAGRRECVCISVDSPGHLYLVDGFTASHNTIQAIGVINASPDIKKVLVVAPASLKLNWKREMEKWFTRPLSIGIAGKGIPDTDVVILNYDVLNKHKDALMSHDWDVLIADEAHYVKNPAAQRTKALVGGEKKIDGKYTHVPGISDKAKRKLFLTGTPILNRPIELWPIASALAPQTFPSFMSFAKRYADAKQERYGWDFSGASHLDELQDKLRSTVMVRRLKADVLKELPAKRRQVIELEVPPEARHLIAQETALAEEHAERLSQYRAAVELAKASESEDDYKVAVARLREAAQVAFEEISKERHEIALAKAPQVIEHLKDDLEQVDKIIVFAHHRDVIDAIVSAFPGQAVRLTGEDSVEDRQKAVDSFQNDPKVKLFVGSIKAAGVGITLTAASHVAFAELDWVPANITQAEDRAHRIGQTDSVMVEHLVFDGSLDSKMAKTLVDKQIMIDQALDIEPPPVAPIEEPATKQVSRRALAEYDDLPDSEIATVMSALRFLSSVDDGAFKQDFAGFNGVDTRIGNELARLSVLTHRQARLGSILVQKYKGQLERAGLSVPQMPQKHKAVAKPDAPATVLMTSVQPPSEIAAVAPSPSAPQPSVSPFEVILEGSGENWKSQLRRIFYNVGTGRFVISFPYNPDLVTAVKFISGVRFNRDLKDWELADSAANLDSVKAMLTFAKGNDFAISPDACDKVGEIVASSGGKLVSAKSIPLGEIKSADWHTLPVPPLVELQSIQAARTDSSRMQDEMLSNRNTVDADDVAGVQEWVRDPGEVDIRGVDTPTRAKYVVQGRKRRHNRRGLNPGLGSMR